MKTTVNEDEAEITIEPEPRPRSPTPPPSRGVTSAERSRASSVTEAVNALRNAYDSDSVSSRAPSFHWMHSERERHVDPAPQPKAGDVMFFPADAHVKTTRHEHHNDEEESKKHESDYVYTQVIKASVAEPDPPSKEDREAVYGYTKVIRASTRSYTADGSGRDSPVAVAGTSHANEGYEVPIRRTTMGTREVPYETEHGPIATGTSKMGVSMSDRLTRTVEDGDRTRFSAYNLGAMNFADEDNDDDDKIDPAQLRVKRPDTPPSDIPRRSVNRSSYRPPTPPNDIPLITPRESREVPPLNLPSTVTSPRDPYASYRPATPPTDFPITPRPPTPPLYFQSNAAKSPRPATPPFDAPDTSRSAIASPLNRSLAIDPSTGDPGSFQARQRLIESHLKKNQSGGPAPKPQTTTPAAPKFKAAPEPPKPYVPPVKITPGVIPPPPPPPPLPK